MQRAVFPKFTFRIPYTNPVYFGRVKDGGYERRIWDDSLDNEQYRQYTQRWHPSDRLSLQFSWSGLKNDNSASIVIRFFANGVLKKNIERTIGNSMMQGDMYSDFIVQGDSGNGFLNGCYCFSQIVSEIEDDDQEQMLSDGDCLYIEIEDPAGVVWRSNRMLVTNDVAGTKRIHYVNVSGKDQYMLDTYFGYMPFGYDLRIEGDFMEITPNLESSVFQDYGGGYTLVSAMPFETANFVIGDNAVRIPRYMLRTLNSVFSCDKKEIDGVGFEITGEGLNISRVEGYANDVCSVVVAKSQNTHSYSSEGENVFNAYVQPSHTIERNDYDKGSITIMSSGDWYVDGYSLSESGIILEKVVGGPGVSVIKYSMPKNHTQSDITHTISFVSVDDGSVIGQLSVLSRKTFRNGLGYMSIDDTFAIS